MTNESPVRFTLSNNTNVFIKKVTNSKYDFELIFPNGSRKTFIWWTDEVNEYCDRKGQKDELIAEAVQQFRTLVHA